MDFRCPVPYQRGDQLRVDPGECLQASWIPRVPRPEADEEFNGVRRGTVERRNGRLGEGRKGPELSGLRRC
jgi:hypothetical protein